MLKWLAAAVAAMAAAPLALLLVVSVGAASGSAAAAFAGGPTALAKSDIPPALLVLYMDAAQTCPGLPWAVLAGIGKVESDHGRSRAPGIRSGSNKAGGEGPMQLLPTTFGEYAVDGDRDGTLNIYDPADATFTAAAMLCANGAASATPGGLSRAVYAYNHAQSYMAGVFAWAARYAAPAWNATGAESRIAARAIAFALAQLGKPYVWGATGPDAYDCSGLVYAAYASAGIHICPHHVRLAPGRPAGSADRHPARRPAVFRRFGWHPGKPRPCRDVPRRRAGHPGATGRRDGPS